MMSYDYTGEPTQTAGNVAAAYTQLGMAQAKPPMPQRQDLALETHASELAAAISRIKSARRRVCEAADKCFGPQPEQPVSSAMVGIEVDRSITTLLRDLHSELCDLEHQVGRL